MNSREAPDVPGATNLLPVSGRMFRSPKRAGRLSALFLLLGVLGVAYYNVIFLGQTLVASSDYHPFDYRSDVIRVGSATSSAYVNWYDPGGTWWQWEPAGVLFSQELRKGRIPMWDPSPAGGVDTHVNLTQGQYYPPYVLLLLLGDTPLERDVYYLAQLFVSAWFCYLLLRRNGLSSIAAASAGACYMLGGAMTQNVNSILGQTFAVLPVMIWATDWLLSRPSARRMGATALILSVCLLSSFLPVVISGYLLVGLYVLISAILLGIGDRSAGFNWSIAARAAAFASGAVILSFLITAFLFVPVELASSRDPSFSQWYRGVGLFSYGADQLLTLISPTVSFDMWLTLDPSQLLFKTPYSVSFFYVGLVPVMLAAVARPGRSMARRKLWIFFLSGSILLLLKLLGVPPVQWIGYLPVLNQLHFVPYFCGALTLCIAGLAGIGVETLMRRRSAWAAGAAVLVLLIVFVGIIRFGQTEPLNPVLQGPALFNALARFGLEGTRIALVGVGTLVVVWLRARGLGARSAGILLFLLIGVDLIPLVVHTRFLRSDVWRQPPNYVRFLQNDHSGFRVHGVHDLALTPNVGEGLGIDLLSSRVSFNSSRYSEIVQHYFTAAQLPYPLARSILPASRNLLNVMNVKYLLLFSPSPADIAQMQAAGLVEAEHDGDFHIFQNPQVFPRAYIASGVRVASDPQKALEALTALNAGEVALEQALEAKGSGGEVQSLQNDFDSVSMRVKADGPGLLVFEENAAPGWQATVNGQATPILAANYAFQAVRVPTGVSEVNFRYRSPGLMLGMIVTLAGLIAAVGAIVLSFNRRSQ